MKTEIQRAKNPTLTLASDLIIKAVRGKRSNSYSSTTIDPNYNHFKGFEDAFEKIKAALVGEGFVLSYVEVNRRPKMGGMAHETVVGSAKHRYSRDGRVLEVTGYYACGANLYVKAL
jgi:hypothetical protein